MRQLRKLVNAIRSGDFSALFYVLWRRLWFESWHYGLARDLDVPFSAPQAAIPLEIRVVRETDMPKLLSPSESEGPDRELVRMHRLDFARAGIGTCYVAATEGDEPSYMQWLMLSAENDAVARYFKGIFPTLAADEALLEYAYTRRDFRGKGVMPAAMARIAEKAKDHGARRVITFVGRENIAALKGCQRAGFVPYCMRVDRWRLLRRRVTFSVLAPGTPYPYDG